MVLICRLCLEIIGSNSYEPIDKSIYKKINDCVTTLVSVSMHFNSMRAMYAVFLGKRPFNSTSVMFEMFKQFEKCLRIQTKLFKN